MTLSKQTELCRLIEQSRRDVALGKTVKMDQHYFDQLRKRILEQQTPKRR